MYLAEHSMYACNVSIAYSGCIILTEPRGESRLSPAVSMLSLLERGLVRVKYIRRNRIVIIVSNLGWLSWIIFGALAGWVASILTRNNSRMGCLGNIIVGIIGAFLGGWIYSLITGHPLIVGWNWTAFIVAVLGAVILLALLNLLFGRRA
jgi:uncharacterized membrane protein YeaQ/YmgE (transglycosylase-associated protein family)